MERGNLAASVKPVIPVQKESSWLVYLYGVTSHRSDCPFVCWYSDNISSATERPNSQQTWALQFFQWKSAIFQQPSRVCFAFFRLTETAEWLSSKSPPTRWMLVEARWMGRVEESSWHWFSCYSDTISTEVEVLQRPRDFASLQVLTCVHEQMRAPLSRGSSRWFV